MIDERLKRSSMHDTDSITIFWGDGLATSGATMRRKSIAVAIMTAALWSHPVSASEWWYTGATPDRAVFVDAATLVRGGTTVEIWEYAIARRPVSGIHASKRRTVIDCKTLEARLLQVVDYDESRSATVPLVYSRLPPKFLPAADAASASAYRFACGPESARTTAGAKIASDPEAMSDGMFGATR